MINHCQKERQAGLCMPVHLIDALWALGFRLVPGAVFSSEA